MHRQDLDPWRVILHHLFNIDSREIPKIVDRAGLAVDWNLNDRDDYSNKTRLAAYRPRIVGAYEALTEDDRLRVAYIVVQSLPDDALELLDRDLRKVGWKIESGRLVPDSTDVSELFFPTGSQHDAYVEIRRILQYAQDAVVIIDPYVDSSILTLLRAEGKPPKSIRILTYGCPDDFSLEATRFQAQFSESAVEVRKTREFHDRFVIVDNHACWHIGASIKDAGVRAFMINQVEDDQVREAIRSKFEDSWRSARPIGTSGQHEAASKQGVTELAKNFDAIRRRILYCSVTNEVPPALRDLRSFLIDSGLVERPAFRKFFEDWLASPFVAVGAPVPNLLAPEQLRQLLEDLTGLTV